MLNLGVRQSVGAEPEVKVNALTGGLGVVEFIRHQRLSDLSETVCVCAGCRGGWMKKRAAFLL